MIFYYSSLADAAGEFNPEKDGITLGVAAIATYPS